MNAVREAPEAPADNLHSLEQKVYRTIELLKAAREAKASADQDILHLMEQLEAKEAELETLRNENLDLRKERDDVHSRVEKLLEQIDTVEDVKE